MMSRPDFMEKQVLLVDSKDSRKLKFKNSNLVVADKDDKPLRSYSCHRLFLVVVLGECTITSVLVKSAQKHGFPVVFLNMNLKPYLVLDHGKKGNVLLRKKQYLGERDLEIAKVIVKNKISNQLSLMKSLRYKTKEEKAGMIKVKSCLKEAERAITSKELLGIEGTAAKIFFKVYFKNLDYKKRESRERKDTLNLLFDIGYSQLFNFIEANLELYGFDTYLGVYHKFFYQRKSLVCDIMEPFRCIIERKIRKGYNLKQIRNEDFEFKKGECFVKRKFKKKYHEFFLNEILDNKEQIFLYVQKYYRAFIKEKDIKEFPEFLPEFK